MVEVAPEKLAESQDLYERGLILQAYRAALGIGPLAEWRGAEAMVLAGRIAVQLGGNTLARWLFRRAWRLYPENFQVRYYYAFHMARARGPYAAWRWMREAGSLATEQTGLPQAEWRAALGELAACMRDFDTAEKLIDEAVALHPQHAWFQVCRSSLLEQQDRYEEALAAARRALELRPWYCAALEIAGHLLTLLDRDEEALQLLGAAVEKVESMRLVGQLYALRLELKQYEAAQTLLNRCADMAPLAERAFRRWLAGQRSDLAYHLGDLPEAVEQAKQAGPGFYQSVADRLEANLHAPPSAVVLPVGFVRQHQMTCGPATLAAVSRYWSQPADHLAVADEICYNGTTNYRERHWAETHGWRVREFSVTEDSAAALLDRGVPLTLTTIDPGNSHLQAIIGYDRRRGVFHIRDPFFRHSTEGLVDKVLERYAAFGPRGMAMVPLAESARLDGLDLPDAQLWDRLHALDAALVEHRRGDAEAICAELCAQYDGHRLSYDARCRLACYDADPIARLSALDKLLELAAENPCVQLYRLSCMTGLARRDERLAVLERLCEKRDAHPIFLQQLAQEFQADARRHGEAITLLRRAIRCGPQDPGNYYALANVYWDQQRFDEAFELYRFAACLNDKDEYYAECYFRAAVWVKQTESVLAFLRDRFRRFGGKSNLPARTLIRAYLQQDRVQDALAALSEALQLRPDDGELRLFAADIQLECSRENAAEARRLLEQAKGLCPPAQWLRTAAGLAAGDGQPEEALRLWREVLDSQPLAVDAHRAVAQLLAEIRGRAAALEHLSAAVERFPHYQPLYQLLLEWLRDEPAEVRETAIRRSVTANPHDAWLRRELAFFLVEQRRVGEAWPEVELAGQYEPNIPPHRYLRAQLLAAEGKIEAALAELKEVIRLSVDYRWALDLAVSLCPAAEQRRELLAFVKSELLRQAVIGEGLQAFRQQAHGTLDAEELRGVVEEILRRRPDVWQSWSVCLHQLLSMNLRDEALDVARRATERFPLLPPLWLDRAEVCQALHDLSGEREALQTAHRISPEWDTAVCSLADFHIRQGEFDDARQRLERATARKPLNVYIHVMLAELLWRLDEREAALERIRRAIELEPGHQRAWNDLKTWGAALGRPTLAAETAETLTRRRGGEARSWFLLADTLDGPEQLERRLAALDKAATLNPRYVDAYNYRAYLLAEARRWDEARQACFNTPWADNPPLELKGRAIWLLAMEGRADEAVEKMQTLLVEEPGYWEGWCWLWEWHREKGAFDGCIDDAEALMRLNPNYEITLGYLAEAHRLNGNLREAETHFQRAYELNPRYEYAGLHLFDLYIDQWRLEESSKVLGVMQLHSDNACVQSRAVELEVVRANVAAYKERFAHIINFGNKLLGKKTTWEQTHGCAAAEHLRRICLNPQPDDASVNFAVQKMLEAGWRRTVEKELSELVFTDGACDETGRQWARLCVKLRRWKCGKQLRALAQRGSIGVAAAVGYIEALTETRRQGRFFLFFRANKHWLHQHARTWGAVGFAMAHLGAFAYKRIRWMKDWRREDAESWMLVNLVDALRLKKRDAEAVEVSRYALTLPPDDSQNTHRAWVAVEDACRGDIDSARRLLDEIPPDSMNAYYSFVVKMATTVVEVATMEKAGRDAVAARATQKIKEAVSIHKTFNRDHALWRIYMRCLRAIAANIGGRKGKAWFYKRLLRSL